MNNGFSNESKGYIKTTENINGYFDLLDMEDKDILTVVGSDQIFEAIVRGAKNIDAFDISTNSIMLYYLKEAAIKSLEYEEYMNFFYVENSYFNKETYNKIRNNLREDALKFWDNVFSHEEYINYLNGCIVHKPSLYTTYRVAEHKLLSLSTHLKERWFNYVKAFIDRVNVNIYQLDVYELDKLNKTYDYIILSNIFEYQNDEEFKSAIERYRNMLNENGLLIVGYAYNDVNIDNYSEYNQREVPSRFMAWGNLNAPSDHIITAGRR